MKAWNWKRMAVALCVSVAALVPVGAAHSALSAGDRAPTFALAATTAKQVSNKDFPGKTLVLFFYTGAVTNS